MPTVERIDRAIMIDAPDTEDRDDAIWVDASDTGFEASVHIALVSDHFSADSNTDRQACKRIHSKYLPHTTIGMLPKEIEHAASLRHGAVQPTLRVDLSFAPDGEMLACTVDRGTLRDSHAISYSAAAHILTTPEGRTDPLHPVLGAANGLANVLLNRRQSRGALAFYDVFKGWATNEEGHLIRLGRDQRNTGYIIVQELMIAANSAIATWCGQRDIPILFRNHQLATVAGDRNEILSELAAMENHAEPAGYEMMRKRMSVVQRPATYAPVVFGHHGLSLPAYTHATSPLRRYSDLVNQRILLAAIDQQPAPFDFARLQELGDDLNDRIQAERQRRAEHHRRQARQTTRDRLSEADFDTLDATQFTKVLRLALRQDDPAVNLVAEAGRRFEDDSLPLRDSCEILFQTRAPAWAPLRGRINRHLAAESGRALTVLSMHAQAVIGGPIGNEQLRWHVRSVGNARQPCFEARLELNLESQRHVSPPRRQPSKKEAKAQAALALVAQLGEVEDLSRDDETPIELTEQRRERVPVDHHPVMAINQYSQTGALRDVTWSYDRSGPPHQPTFTCTVSAIVLDESAPIEASGSGNSKQLAKADAAKQLWSYVDERLNVAQDSRT